MRNDRVQGIIFDANQTIMFRDAPSSFEKLTTSLLLFLKGNWSKPKPAKPYQPTFSTDLMPNKTTTQSTLPKQGVSGTTHIVLR